MKKSQKEKKVKMNQLEQMWFNTPKKEKKVQMNPLRMQPDYLERDLYQDMDTLSNVVNDVYKSAFDKEIKISEFKDFLHKFDHQAMVDYEMGD